MERINGEKRKKGKRLEGRKCMGDIMGEMMEMQENKDREHTKGRKKSKREGNPG